MGGGYLKRARAMMLSVSGGAYTGFDGRVPHAVGPLSWPGSGPAGAAAPAPLQDFLADLNSIFQGPFSSAHATESGGAQVELLAMIDSDEDAAAVRGRKQGAANFHSTDNTTIVDSINAIVCGSHRVVSATDFKAIGKALSSPRTMRSVRTRWRNMKSAVKVSARLQ